MITPEEERTRRELALIKFEAAVAIVHKYVHGIADEIIQTESGPMPTLRGLTKQLNAHEADVQDFLSQMAATLDALPDVGEDL